MKVRYYGHFGQRTGFGRAAHETAMALLTAYDAELEVRISANDGYEKMAEALSESYAPLIECLRIDSDLDPSPDAIIVHTLPGDCHKALEMPGVTRGEGTKVVAYTTWEARTAPPAAILDGLEQFDQVWVPSKATRNAFPVEYPDLPWNHLVRVVPHANKDAAAGPITNRPTPDNLYRFYYIGAWNSRKNPMGVLRAYTREFTPADPVELVMHVPGTSKEMIAAAVHSTGLNPAKDMPRVKWSLEPISDLAITMLHAECDCFVTAARGEAWNLPAFDAMLAGRFIISTGGLGSDDFLRDTDAMLYGGMASPAQVDVSIVPQMMGMPPGAVNLKIVGGQGLSCKATWLEPDLIRLAESMRNAYQFRKRDLSLKYNPADRYSYRAVGKLALGFLLESQPRKAI